ncbi:MAG: alkaline phosphatase D family protein [Actinomycetota bacterium]|nr:alkaline phosphatase D family protein [Actinomycetota bacterium]
MIAFRHGVASADPLPDGVLLWTRCSTDDQGPLAVEWWVGTSTDPSSAVARGTAESSPEGDHTVHVDVGGLEPATTYWYGFGTGGVRSPTGRTRTAPAVGQPLDHLRLGLASCASWPCGYFNAYADLARRELDLVVHVGDYLYENDRVSPTPRAVRAHRPNGALVSLADYRRRHAQYRTDPDLQALHARHPMVAVWDDHEIAGGAWRDGATDHRPRFHGSWELRKAAAVRAYREWVPVRSGNPGVVHRRVRLGPLADLVMLDTRLIGRDRPAEDGQAVRTIGYGGRALLGEAQWRWLEEQITDAARPKWLLLGNQVVMAPVRALGIGGGFGFNPSQWDGYPAERERLYRLLRSAGWAADVAVLSGDLHSSWASDLPVGAEFVSPSVTTDTFARTVLPTEAAARPAAWWFRTQNRHVRMVDLRHHGYVVVDVTPDRIQADWWHVATLARRDPAERWAGGWRLAQGRLGLERAGQPVSATPASEPSSRSAGRG